MAMPILPFLPEYPALPTSRIREVNVYSVVLLAAMTGGGQGAGMWGPDWGHGGPVGRPLGGVVHFFFLGPIDISPEEMHDWMEYIDALDEQDKDFAMYTWCKADCKGRKFLLGQVMVMRPVKAYVPEPIDPKKIDKADKDDKDPKKIEKDDKDDPKKIEKDKKDKTDKDTSAIRSRPGAQPVAFRQEIAAPATLIVSLPAEARLKVGGHVVKAAGGVRTLRSPALEPGKAYEYTLEADLEQDGRTRVVRQVVEVRAGAEVRVKLEVPDTWKTRR
jgi:uncharacterized protein (TIGR03000 family)